MRTSGSKKNGFTLIELLVVISIIALLLSIVMPALNRARGMARTVVCQSNTRQLAVAWEMFTSDNDGLFINAGNHGGNYGGTYPDLRKAWWVALKPFYQDAAVLLCPEATKSQPTGIDFTEAAWPVFDIDGKTTGELASVGINSFILNPGPEHAVGGRPRDWYWRTKAVKGADNIPMLADSYNQGGWPHHADSPPEYRGQRGSRDDAMKHFALDRHQGRTNIAFLDSSVKTVAIKELWTLKWHTAFDTQGRWTSAKAGYQPAWPEWMRSLPTD